MSSGTFAEESPFVAREQRDTANHLGMWTFLATEIMFFGGLFACYAIFHWAYPIAFAEGSRHLEFWIGTINTGLLLTSSVCVALGDIAIRAGHRRKLELAVIAAWLLGAAFLGLKFVEYYQKYREQMIPGLAFHLESPHAPQVELFIFLYFVMTGLHALHMVAGLIALAWLWRQNRRGRLTAEDHAPVQMVGLYWHFVDTVWVFLYPLLYLLGR